ncbi:MAG: HNH endonuclease [Candidatus Nanohaloarchaea archaeon]
MPPQGSYKNIGQQEKLKPLLEERLENSTGQFEKEGTKVQVTEDLPDNRDEEYRVSKRKKRDSVFASRVKKLYGYQCAFCGAERYSPDGNPEVEAAHIKPVSEGGPDHPRNGLALCRLHHWAYDNGWLEINSDLEIEVKGPKERPEYEEFKNLHNEEINSPGNEELKPASKYIR